MATTRLQQSLASATAFFFLLSILIIFPNPALAACASCVHQSKVAYFANSEAINVGACGFGPFAKMLYGGNVGAATSKIYRNGVGCSACYQVRCTNPKLCTKSGSTIVVTDLTPNNRTDFVVTPRAFLSLALPQKGRQLLEAGIVDIDYKRTPCTYKGQNLVVKVDKSSQYPYYLAVQFLYQGGQTDIVSVDVAQVGTSEWHYMTRNYGAVWQTQSPPRGGLQFRFQVTSGYDGKWLWARKSVLPSDWKSGHTYDSGLQITDIALENCRPCGDDRDAHWTVNPPSSD